MHAVHWKLLYTVGHKYGRLFFAKQISFVAEDQWSNKNYQSGRQPSGEQKYKYFVKLFVHIKQKQEFYFAKRWNFWQSRTPAFCFSFLSPWPRVLCVYCCKMCLFSRGLWLKIEKKTNKVSTHRCYFCIIAFKPNCTVRIVEQSLQQKGCSVTSQDTLAQKKARRKMEKAH